MIKGTDLDFNGRFIHVQRNFSRVKISATENGKNRIVDMSTQLADVLGDMLSKHRARRYAGKWRSRQTNAGTRPR
jgi:hypothetical protein